MEKTPVVIEQFVNQSLPDFRSQSLRRSSWILYPRRFRIRGPRDDVHGPRKFDPRDVRIPVTRTIIVFRTLNAILSNIWCFFFFLFSKRLFPHLKNEKRTFFFFYEKIHDSRLFFGLSVRVRWRARWTNKTARARNIPTST